MSLLRMAEDQNKMAGLYSGLTCDAWAVGMTMNSRPGKFGSSLPRNPKENFKCFNYTPSFVVVLSWPFTLEDLEQFIQ